MSLKIWAHNPGSHTAAELATRLRCRVLAAPGATRWTPRRGDVVINYGNSDWTDRITHASLYHDRYKVMNHPVYVHEMSNKLYALQQISGYVPEPDQPGACLIPYTPSQLSAIDWARDGYDVVCRHSLKGHSGAGIEIVSAEQYRETGHMPSCELYTRYVKKNMEHRVHMFRNTDDTVDFIWQQKKRRIDCSEPNWRIRNYENGFIYAIEEVVKPSNHRHIEDVLKQTCNLTFSATDLITPNSTNSRAVRDRGPMILEVNSAPGLQSDTLLTWYVDHIRRWMDE